MRDRVFVVGAPRSGTTLLQSLLNSHSRYVSFPESHFFAFLIFDRQFRTYGSALRRNEPLWRSQLRLAKLRLRTWRDIPNPAIRRRIPLFLQRAGLEAHQARFDRQPDSVRALSAEFIALLDEVAGDRGWIEKSPNHIHCIDLIERMVPGSFFVHIIRDGCDTLASIMDAATRYESWGRRYLKGDVTVPRLIALWNRAVAQSLRFKGRDNHLILRYEDLIDDSEGQTRHLAERLGVAFEPEMTRLNTSGLILPDADWQRDMGTRIKVAESKFAKVFSPAQRRVIEANLRALPADLATRENGE